MVPVFLAIFIPVKNYFKVLTNDEMIVIPDWIELLSFPFMQRAIIGGILLGLLGGLLGGFVILRKLSMLGNTLSHVALIPVVISTLFQLPTTLCLIGFIILTGIAILYLTDQTDLGSDTILGIVVAGSVALGIMGFTLIEGYRGNLLSILFGDILAISELDLIILTILLVITIVSLVWTLPQQILLTFNPNLAKVQGILVEPYRYGFIILLSLMIALTIRSVGILLVNAFLVIPSATAQLICDEFIPFLIVAASLGAVSSVIGMLISGIWNLPSGPSIVLVQLMTFTIMILFNRYRLLRF
ncbi:MAG: metal ABC transporter permease [Microcoleaceae cyanobacterium]